MNRNHNSNAPQDYLHRKHAGSTAQSGEKKGVGAFHGHWRRSDMHHITGNHMFYGRQGVILRTSDFELQSICS